MQKSGSVLRFVCQGWKAVLPQTLSAPAPRCPVISTHGVRPATSFPLTDLQNMNYQRQAQTSHHRVREEVPPKVQQFVPGQATALHNVWYQQMSGSLRSLTSAVQRENLSAMPHSPHRAVAGMVCGGCVRPLGFPNYNPNLYGQAEANLAALPVGGHLPMRRGMSSWSRSGVNKGEGGHGSSCTNCWQPSGEGPLSSAVDPSGANMSAKQDSSAPCLLHPAARSGVLLGASPPRPLPWSGRRLLHTQTLQRKPTAGQLLGFGVSKAFLGVLGRPEVPAKQLSQLNPRSGIKVDKEHSLKILETDAAWALRLSSENVFLSWCRNTYLGSALGLAMHTAGAGTLYADSAAFLIFSLAGLNLVWGSCAYVHYLFSMGSLAQISRLSRFLQLTFALAQVLLWFYACMCYFSSWDAAFLEEDVWEA